MTTTTRATTSSYQHIVLLVALSTWSYRALLFHPYEWNEYCEHWDDRANFLMSPHVTSTLSFSSFYTMCTTSRINVWEPYGNLLKKIIFAFGGTAWTQRIVSWFFHTSSSILLYFLSQNVLRLFLSTDPTTSIPNAGTDHAYMATSTRCFVGTAIWLCSPLHVEVVGWASAQPYTPAVFLSLCSLHVYVSKFQHRTSTFMVRSVALFGCGLLFKSVVLLLLPAAILCLELMFGSLHFFYKNTSIVGYLLVAGCIGWITMLENDGSDSDMVAIASVVQRTVKANSMIWMYIRYFMWPSSLRPHYRLAGELGDGRNAYSLDTNVHNRDGTLAAMYSFAIALGCVPSLLFQRRGQKMKMLLVSFMYVFICFLPTTGIVQHGMVQAGGDRYVYIPSLIVVVVAAGALQHLRNNSFALVSIVLLLFSWSEICNQQVKIWKNDTSMLHYSLQVDPNDWRALSTLVMVRRERHEDVNALITRTLHAMPQHHIEEGKNSIIRVKVALSRAGLLALQNKLDAACTVYDQCIAFNIEGVDSGGVGGGGGGDDEGGGNRDSTRIIDADHNAKIMTLVNSAVCRCHKLKEIHPATVLEIKHAFELAIKLSASSLTDKKVADFANNNFAKFYQWEQNNFEGVEEEINYLKEPCKEYEQSIGLENHATEDFGLGAGNDAPMTKGDHNAKIVALANAAVCQVFRIFRVNATVVLEIDKLLNMSVESASSVLTEKRIIDVANSNKKHFDRWRKENFFGPTEMELLY